jgi:hypothetical protein
VNRWKSLWFVQLYIMLQIVSAEDSATFMTNFVFEVSY